MKRKLLIAVLGLILLSGCLSAEDIKRQDANIAALEGAAKELATLQQTYKDMKAKYLSGSLSIEDFTRVSIEVSDKIKDAELVVSQVKGDIEKQRESGTGWVEIIASTLIGMALRGVPSKGPIGMLVNSLGLRRKEG